MQLRSQVNVRFGRHGFVYLGLNVSVGKCCGYSVANLFLRLRSSCGLIMAELAVKI